ncbi:hypothetical protein ES705_44191 [subsurface metagenome]
MIKAIAGANQAEVAKQIVVESEYVGAGDDVVLFPLAHGNIMENTEKVFSSGVLKSRSKKYLSRFVGDNAADNKGFDEGIGDWVSGNPTVDTIAMVSGGHSGNCLKYLAGAEGTPVAGFLTLPGGNGVQLTNLVDGQHYRLQIAISILDGAFAPTINIKCTGGPVSTLDIVPTSEWKVIVYEFTAEGTDATIEIIGSAAPTDGNVLYINSLELERVDGDYVMNWDKGEVIFTEAPVLGTIETISLGEGGTGYAVGDVLTVVQAGGSGGTVVVDSVVTGGIITAVTILTKGSDYTVADGLTTTGGTGSGATINILTIGEYITIGYTYATGETATHDVITGGDIEDSDYIDNVALVGTITGKGNDVICIVKNALADAGFSLSTAPRDEAVPVIVFTGHHAAGDPDTEPWEIRYPRK